MDYEVGEEIVVVWSFEVIVWSFVVATLGAYVALTSAVVYIKQVRGTIWYWPLICQAGLALGVSCVWSMHFVGMHAVQLQTPGKPRVDIGYEPLMTVVSGSAAWLISTIALHIILSRDFLSKEGVDQRGVHLKMSHSSMTSREWPRAAKRLPFRRLVLSAVLVSVGVVIMHYMGMLSQRGDFSMELSVVPIVASMVVAGVAASVALPIFLLAQDSMVLRILSSLGIGLMVNAMHYTGMSSATYTFQSESESLFDVGITWRMHYKDVLLFAFLLDLLLMGFAGYYVEVARAIVIAHEEDVEEKLTFQQHKKRAKTWIKDSRTMSFPMSLLRCDTFARLGRLVPHEALRDAHKLVYLGTVKDVLLLKKKNNAIVFFSHQWLSYGVPDPSNDHYSDMICALQGLSTTFRVRMESWYVFVDYSSIPQEGRSQQQLAIDSLATYVSLCSAFVIVAPQTVHAQMQSLCNFDTYKTRFWCRLEVFCTVLSSVRESHLKTLDSELTVEEGEEHDGSHHHPSAGAGSADQLPSRTIAEGAAAHSAPLASSAASGQPRIFVVVKGGLRPLNFFTPEGTIQPRYQDFIHLYDGDARCCQHGHKAGEEHKCDKARLVESLAGAYGAMLQDVGLFMKSTGRTSEQSARIKLVEEIVRRRADIFPSAYFGSRIDAIHARRDRGLLVDEDTATAGAERHAAHREDSDVGSDSTLRESSGTASECDPRTG